MNCLNLGLPASNETQKRRMLWRDVDGMNQVSQIHQCVFSALRQEARRLAKKRRPTGEVMIKQCGAPQGASPRFGQEF